MYSFISSLNTQNLILLLFSFIVWIFSEMIPEIFVALHTEIEVILCLLWHEREIKCKLDQVTLDEVSALFFQLRQLFKFILTIMLVILFERGVAGIVISQIIFGRKVFENFIEKIIEWSVAALQLIIFFKLRLRILVKIFFFLIRLCNTILKLFNVEWIPQKVICIVAFQHLLLWSPVFIGLILAKCMVWHGAVSKQFSASLLL